MDDKEFHTFITLNENKCKRKSNLGIEFFNFQLDLYMTNFCLGTSILWCVCVCHFFYDDEAMGNHITLSQLDVAAPESSYPLGDKPVSQPALSQTLVGHSVIVVRRVYSLVSNFISRHL